MTLEILEPGLSTTVQDRGRSGHYNVGIPQGGSMDQLSAEIVNALVGNSLEEAVLECTYLGPKFRTSARRIFRTFEEWGVAGYHAPFLACDDYPA